MGERKVLNKYIPADFDPSLVPRGKKLSSKDGTVPVRMMLPFSIQCNYCATFLYRGRKFNSKKEPMGGNNGKYLGITRFRFYIKCTHCSRSITFLTDPKNADYEMESGGTRNYEIQKDKASTEEEIQQEQIEDEKLDPMKALENRVLQSQQEMHEMDQLEEIKAMNARHVKLLSKNDTSAILSKKRGLEDDGVANGKEVNDDLLTEEDEALIQSIQFANTKGQQQQQQQQPVVLLRLNEQDELLLEEKRKREIEKIEEYQHQQHIITKELHPSKQHSPSLLTTTTIQIQKRPRIHLTPSTNKDNKFAPKISVSKEAAISTITAATTTGVTTSISNSTTGTATSNHSNLAKDTAARAGLESLLGGYGSDSSED